MMHMAAREDGDRQAAHERIRQHSLEAARRIAAGEQGGLFEMVAGDEELDITHAQLEALAEPAALTGLAGRQVRAFLAGKVAPVLERYPAQPAAAAEEVRV